jgi:hypothetical protein
MTTADETAREYDRAEANYLAALKKSAPVSDLMGLADAVASAAASAEPPT